MREWWRGGVIYQVYPRSFQDSNGDGIGDLPGIMRRLDHIASLGVDAVWLSPITQSPQADMGYDVSDYKEVDRLFGSLEDFDSLIERAHSLGLKVIMDQVVSHSSEASVVPRKPAEPHQCAGRLVCLGRPQARWVPAQQLAGGIRRARLGMEPEPRPVLFP